MVKQSRHNSNNNGKNPQAQIMNHPQTKFTLYNLAGKEKAYYLVDKANVAIQPEKAPKKQVAHSIIIIDRSGSMYHDIADLKDTLIKLLTLDEYSNYQLVVTLISYSSQGDLTCHFQRIPIQQVMRKNSPYLAEIRNIRATYLTCISQALQLAKSLIESEELTAITLHSDGYANDSSPSAEVKALEIICEQLKKLDVFVNTIAYSSASDFKLLAKIANTVSGRCIKAGNVQEVYEGIYSTSKLLADAVGVVWEEILDVKYSYQVFFSRSAKRVNGASQTLKIFGLRPDDAGVIYKYRLITKDEYQQLIDVSVAQNHESVYAFARANLAEGNLNTAKYATASTFDATLTEKYAKALTNQDIADFAQDIDIALFYPKVLTEHQILQEVKVNNKISLLELMQIFSEHRQNIIVNLKHLQENYQRKGIKRVKGVRDKNGELIKPWLSTEYIDQGEYVEIGTFEINHNTATINMLIKRKVKLVKAEDKTAINEVAGLLVNNLATFNNYTIVSDGEINIKSLQVKISSKQTFDLLKSKGVIDADKFDFHAEYTLQLDNLPLVPFDGYYSSIDGSFTQLAEIKVLSSIISALLRNESDFFIPEQVDELKNHYLSKNLYLNFPTTNEYSDLKSALANGIVDTHVSYKIDIGSPEILNFSKLHSANKFLERRYQAYDKVTGEIFTEPTLDLTFQENIAFRHKPISARMKITKVDDFMQTIFDDFLGIVENGKVAEILHQVGADSLALVMQAKHASKSVSKEELVSALAAAKKKLEQYAEKIYREKISPLVFYIGSTGLLPDEMTAKAMTADELASRYPHLHFSKHEKEGTFFVVGDSIISVYSQVEYYSKKAVVGVEE